ncbi:MAG TPA: PA2779 family protein [Burkholderiales bacterium]|nr:PA2779 family protein [Burkholderiales bacterium]
MMTALKRVISSVLIVCTLGAGMPLPASAGIIATDQVATSAERDRVKALLDRAEVRERLQALGVDPAAARTRVDALSDQEIATLAGEMDRLPAGGGDVLTVALIVFLVLLLTDILGYTKIFPFTRPAQK